MVIPDLGSLENAMLLCEIVIETTLLQSVLEELSDPKQSADTPSTQALDDWIDLVREHPATIEESGLREAIERALPLEKGKTHVMIDLLRQVFFARRAGITRPQAQKDMARTILHHWIRVLEEPRPVETP